MAIGITFKETMAGWFVLGETDPRAGAKKGRADGVRLAMHATVTIDDIDRFIAQETHPGKLSGVIDYPPFGDPIAAPSGVFNLFSPAGEPGLHYMVYELTFAQDGKPRYLAGRKHVRDDQEFDLWSDTTTLFTTLHDGDNADAPVIGAGVLRLDLMDFMKLISTLRATGTRSAAAKAKAIGKFGTFFMGELWNTYGPGD